MKQRATFKRKPQSDSAGSRGKRSARRDPPPPPPPPLITAALPRPPPSSWPTLPFLKPPVPHDQMVPNVEQLVGVFAQLYGQFQSQGMPATKPVGGGVQQLGQLPEGVMSQPMCAPAAAAPAPAPPTNARAQIPADVEHELRGLLQDELNVGPEDAIRLAISARSVICAFVAQPPAWVAENMSTATVFPINPQWFLALQDSAMGQDQLELDLNEVVRIGLVLNSMPKRAVVPQGFEKGIVQVLVLLAKFYCSACYGGGSVTPALAAAYLEWDRSAAALTWRSRPEVDTCKQMFSANNWFMRWIIGEVAPRKARFPSDKQFRATFSPDLRHHRHTLPNPAQSADTEVAPPKPSESSEPPPALRVAQFPQPLEGQPQAAAESICTPAVVAPAALGTGQDVQKVAVSKGKPHEILIPVQDSSGSLQRALLTQSKQQRQVPTNRFGQPLGPTITSGVATKQASVLSRATGVLGDTSGSTTPTLVGKQQQHVITPDMMVMPGTSEGDAAHGFPMKTRSRRKHVPLLPVVLKRRQDWRLGEDGGLEDDESLGEGAVASEELAVRWASNSVPGVGTSGGAGGLVKQASVPEVGSRGETGWKGLLPGHAGMWQEVEMGEEYEEEDELLIVKEEKLQAPAVQHLATQPPLDGAGASFSGHSGVLDIPESSSRLQNIPAPSPKGWNIPLQTLNSGEQQQSTPSAALNGGDSGIAPRLLDVVQKFVQNMPSNGPSGSMLASITPPSAATNPAASDPQPSVLGSTHNPLSPTRLQQIKRDILERGDPGKLTFKSDDGAEAAEKLRMLSVRQLGRSLGKRPGDGQQNVGGEDGARVLQQLEAMTTMQALRQIQGKDWEQDLEAYQSRVHTSTGQRVEGKQQQQQKQDQDRQQLYYNGEQPRRQEDWIHVEGQDFGQLSGKYQLYKERQRAWGTAVEHVAPQFGSWTAATAATTTHQSAANDTAAGECLKDGMGVGKDSKSGAKGTEQRKGGHNGNQQQLPTKGWQGQEGQGQQQHHLQGENMGDEEQMQNDVACRLDCSTGFQRNAFHNNASLLQPGANPCKPTVLVNSSGPNETNILSTVSAHSAQLPANSPSPPAIPASNPAGSPPVGRASNADVSMGGPPTESAQAKTTQLVSFGETSTNDATLGAEEVQLPSTLGAGATPGTRTPTSTVDPAGNNKQAAAHVGGHPTPGVPKSGAGNCFDKVLKPADKPPKRRESGAESGQHQRAQKGAQQKSAQQGMDQEGPVSPHDSADIAPCMQDIDDMMMDNSDLGEPELGLGGLGQPADSSMTCRRPARTDQSSEQRPSASPQPGDLQTQTQTTLGVSRTKRPPKRRSAARTKIERRALRNARMQRIREMEQQAMEQQAMEQQNAEQGGPATRGAVHATPPTVRDTAARKVAATAQHPRKVSKTSTARKKAGNKQGRNKPQKAATGRRMPATEHNPPKATKVTAARKPVRKTTQEVPTQGSEDHPQDIQNLPPQSPRTVGEALPTKLQRKPQQSPQRQHRPTGQQRDTPPVNPQLHSVRHAAEDRLHTQNSYPSPRLKAASAIQRRASSRERRSTVRWSPKDPQELNPPSKAPPQVAFAKGGSPPPPQPSDAELDDVAGEQPTLSEPAKRAANRKVNRGRAKRGHAGADPAKSGASASRPPPDDPADSLPAPPGSSPMPAFADVTGGVHVRDAASEVPATDDGRQNLTAQSVVDEPPASTQPTASTTRGKPPPPNRGKPSDTRPLLRGDESRARKAPRRSSQQRRGDPKSREKPESQTPPDALHRTPEPRYSSPGQKGRQLDPKQVHQSTPSRVQQRHTPDPSPAPSPRKSRGIVGGGTTTPLPSVAAGTDRGRSEPATKNTQEQIQHLHSARVLRYASCTAEPQEHLFVGYTWHQKGMFQRHLKAVLQLDAEQAGAQVRKRGLIRRSASKTSVLHGSGCPVVPGVSVTVKPQLQSLGQVGKESTSEGQDGSTASDTKPMHVVRSMLDPIARGRKRKRQAADTIADVEDGEKPGAIAADASKDEHDVTRGAAAPVPPVTRSQRTTPGVSQPRSSDDVSILPATPPRSQSAADLVRKGDQKASGKVANRQLATVHLAGSGLAGRVPVEAPPTMDELKRQTEPYNPSASEQGKPIGTSSPTGKQGSAAQLSNPVPTSRLPPSQGPNRTPVQLAPLTFPVLNTCIQVDGFHVSVHPHPDEDQPKAFLELMRQYRMCGARYFKSPETRAQTRSTVRSSVLPYWPRPPTSSQPGLLEEKPQHGVMEGVQAWGSADATPELPPVTRPAVQPTSPTMQALAIPPGRTVSCAEGGASWVGNRPPHLYPHPKLQVSGTPREATKNMHHSGGKGELPPREQPARPAAERAWVPSGHVAALKGQGSGCNQGGEPPSHGEVETRVQRQEAGVRQPPLRPASAAASFPATQPVLLRVGRMPDEDSYEAAGKEGGDAQGHVRAEQAGMAGQGWMGGGHQQPRGGQTQRGFGGQGLVQSQAPHVVGPVGGGLLYGLDAFLQGLQEMGATRATMEQCALQLESLERKCAQSAEIGAKIHRYILWQQQLFKDMASDFQRLTTLGQMAYNGRQVQQQQHQGRHQQQRQQHLQQHQLQHNWQLQNQWQQQQQGATHGIARRGQAPQGAGLPPRWE